MKSDEQNKKINPAFVSRFVEAGRASINRNVIAKCLEFHDISLINYFKNDITLGGSLQLDGKPVPCLNEQMDPSIHHVDTLSWCSHQINLEKMNCRRGYDGNHGNVPFYECINNLANVYRNQSLKLAKIDFDQITLPDQLDELICTIRICCKYYIADCLKKAQEDAIAHGSNILTARHVYEAARKNDRFGWI